jgi:hypothetical protein
MPKKILIPGSILVTVLFVCIVYGSLNYSGFCFKKMGYLSDDEKIRRAVAIISKGELGTSHHFNKTLGRADIYRRTIPYESVDVFLQQNPNCCTLILKRNEFYEADKYDHGPPTFHERVFGKYNYGVKVKYIMRYIEGPLDEKRKEGPGQEFQKIKEVFYSAGNCGEDCVSCFK